MWESRQQQSAGWTNLLRVEGRPAAKQLSTVKRHLPIFECNIISGRLKLECRRNRSFNRMDTLKPKPAYLMCVQMTTGCRPGRDG